MKKRNNLSKAKKQNIGSNKTLDGGFEDFDREQDDEDIFRSKFRNRENLAKTSSDIFQSNLLEQDGLMSKSSRSKSNGLLKLSQNKPSDDQNQTQKNLGRNLPLKKVKKSKTEKTAHLSVTKVDASSLIDLNDGEIAEESSVSKKPKASLSSLPKINVSKNVSKNLSGEQVDNRLQVSNNLQNQG